MGDVVNRIKLTLAICNFLTDMIKEIAKFFSYNKYSSKVIETELNKPLPMTKKDHEDFQNFTKCWICKKVYEEGEIKVKDDDHVTGKYRESVHQESSVNLMLSNKASVVFHNLQNHDSHPIFQKKYKV